VAGVEGITIGENDYQCGESRAASAIIIDEPTIAMLFTINTSPFCGRRRHYVTSSQPRERLDKELLTNVSLRMEGNRQQPIRSRFRPASCSFPF